MVFPAPEALAHRWQLHCISFKGPLAPGSCAPLAERGWLGCVGFSPGNCCSPSRCSWFSAMWLPLQGHAAFWGSVPAVALPSYLRQAADARYPSVPPKTSSNTVRPAVLHMGSVLEALQGLQARPSCRGGPGAPSPRTVASNHLKNVFRTSLPHTQDYQEALMK